MEVRLPVVSKEIAERVAGLSTADSAHVSVLFGAIDRKVADGDFAWVGDLGVEIAATNDVQRQHGVALDRILRALAACPNPESLRALLRVPATLHTEDSKPVLAERRLATYVAHGQRIEDIEQVVFAEESNSVHSREFSACLLHELVLTSARVEEFPALRSFGAALVGEGHPLAALPLSLLPTERGLRRPANANEKWTWVVPPTPLVTFDAPELHATPSMRRRTAEIEMTETSLPALAETMGAAVQHWRHQSNGVITAQEFWSPYPVSPEDFPAVFERLPLTPWPEEEAPGRLYPSTSDAVLRVLLSAAMRSPAYGPGLHGAYGRLAAWRSLAGLTDAPADAPLTGIAELVEQTHWFRIAPTSVWFHQVEWDLAIAALRPGGQEIAVLAATDTD